MCRKVISLLLSLVCIFSITAPAFATESSPEKNDATRQEFAQNLSQSSPERRMSWVYSENPSSGVTYETEYSVVKEGNTKLRQALENFTVSLLAGSLAALLPVSTVSQIVAGAILSSIPTAFKGSTTLYYRYYEYPATAPLAGFCKKVSVYFYYDEDMTVSAGHGVYYGTYC